MSEFIINDQVHIGLSEQIGELFFPRIQPVPSIPESKAAALLAFVHQSKFGYTSSGKADIEAIRLLLSIS